MKQWTFSLALGALLHCSFSTLSAASGISLERLVGRYHTASAFDGKGGDYTITINPDRTLLVYCNGKYQVCLLQDGAMVLKDDGIPRTGPDRKNLPPTILFLPILWGDRTYLLRENQIPSFCDRINLGLEPGGRTSGETRHLYLFGFYLKDGDRSKPVTGDPDLPAPYKKLLLPKPVLGQINEIADGTQAWIDLGRDSGLQPGTAMMIHLPPGRIPKRGEFSFVVMVKEVQQDRTLVEGDTKFFEIGDIVTARRWR